MNIYDQKNMQGQAPAAQEGNTAIRDTLKNRYGVSNGDIGYSDGWVTVKGKNLIKPDWVDDSGTSYVSDPNSLQKAVSSFYANGDTGIRAAAGEFGLDPKQFGYSDGAVTYNGQSFITPDRVQNGVSYTSQDNMLNAVINYYKNNGKNIVKATDYLANSGYPYQVDYNSGMISIAGQTVKPTFVKNGKAYVGSAELDRAIRAAQKQSGIQDRADLLAQQQKQYQPYYDKLLSALMDREAFSYDADSDPAFQSYKQQYEREGDRAMRDAAGTYSGMTGGYMNSAAATAANQQRQYWGDKLMDRIPELLQQAYNRYVTDYDMTRQALDSVMGLDDQQFKRAYGVNDDMINDVRYNNQLQTAREDKAYDRYWEEKKYADDRADIEYNRRQDGVLDQLKIQDANNATYAGTSESRRNDLYDLLQIALLNGYWSDDDYTRSFGIDPTISPYYYQQALSDINVKANNDMATHTTNEAIRQHKSYH